MHLNYSLIIYKMADMMENKELKLTIALQGIDS